MAAGTSKEKVALNPSRSFSAIFSGLGFNFSLKMSTSGHVELVGLSNAHPQKLNAYNIETRS